MKLQYKLDVTISEANRRDMSGAWPQVQANGDQNG